MMKERLTSHILDLFEGCNTIIVESARLSSGNYEVLVEDGVPSKYYVFEIEPCGNIVRQFSC